MSQAHYAEGRAVLRRDVPLEELGAPQFSHLEFTFPLRLLAPRGASEDATVNAAKHDTTSPVKKCVGILFIVSFGGGLVSGDFVRLNVDVGEYTRLLMLTQGSTKVYKERRGGDLPQQVLHVSGPKEVSRQCIHYTVRENATLVLLPAPVTCFARSRYAQVQRFDLMSSATSSLVLLDWFTSGRLAVDHERVPEFWHFYLYHSRNEVSIDGHVIARDRQHLAQELPETLSETTDLARRCEPYTCFANVLLYGPECTALCAALTKEYSQIQQPQPFLRSSGSRGQVTPPDVVWSLSPLCSGAPVPGCDYKVDTFSDKGLVVRIAGTKTDTVRVWLYEHLHLVRHMIGADMYRVALG